MNRRTRTLLFLAVFQRLSCLPGQAPSAVPPAIELHRGGMHVRLFVPDARHGFYTGTRFDWSGVVGELTVGRHVLYHPWFSRVEPTVHDFVYEGADIVAGQPSAITGPADEFVQEDGSAPGFAEAQPGQTFLKIGVGVLRKPDAAPYDHYRQYDIVSPGTWILHRTNTEARFRQTLAEPHTGFAYVYEKKVTLLPGGNRMRLNHMLQNVGTRTIVTRVYNHNFLTVNGQTVGPGVRLNFPFQLSPAKPYDTSLGSMTGSLLEIKQTIAASQRFSALLAGFGTTVADNRFRVEHQAAGLTVAVEGDRPLVREAVWAIRSVIAVEPFVALALPPQTRQRWAYTYTYTDARITGGTPGTDPTH